MQVLPLLLRTCVAGGTAYPYGAWDCLCYCRLVSHWDCLPSLAFHVFVYALITPPPWSILSLFRPPLQRSPSVVTVVTLASTYCSFLVCGDRQEFRESPFVRPQRASLSFADLLYLPPLWRAASPRRESSVGDPAIICLLFHLPTFFAWPKQASLSLPFCAIPPPPPPVMARGPSSERTFRRRPSFHLPFVSFTHLFGAQPERARFSLPFCPIMARGPSGPAYHCLSAQFSPVMVRGSSGPAYHCFLRNLPPLWRAARPRSERSVGGRLSFPFLFDLPTFMARGPSGPASHCLSAQFAPVRARSPSSERAFRGRHSYHLPFVSFAHLFVAWPERASF